MSTKKMLPLHPGESLLEEFLKPMGLSQNRMALDIRVPARRINEMDGQVSLILGFVKENCKDQRK